MTAVQQSLLTEAATAEREAFDDGRLYLLVNEHPRYHNGYSGHVNACGCMKHVGPFAVVHVMSKPARGEIRGYVRIDGMLYLRTPAYPRDWPELDVEVSRQLGCPCMVREPA